jgi:L-lactate dehydrogenase complex protein LldE
MTGGRQGEARRGTRPIAGLFVTCLVDLVRPSVGFAAAKLLRDANCDVVVPSAQTCCGQPAYNSGDSATARAIAKTTIHAFADCDAIVVPSASCAGMLKVHYPRLFADDPEMSAAALRFAARVHELTAYLVNDCGIRSTGATYGGRIACQLSCASLRETHSDAATLQLLRSVAGATISNLKDNQECCGFGGLFSVKYPDISAAMAAKKVAHIQDDGALLVVGPDLGCLFHLAGTLSRAGSSVHCRHVAEVLAGDMTSPPICCGSDSQTMRVP